MDKYLETCRHHQGTISPPSNYLKTHPGYFGSPKTFTSIDWITDHAAILWAAATHGLLTMDRDFLQRWEEPIVKACEFIAVARRARGHKGFPGIRPAAVANDCVAENQALWNDAWTHKALRTAARLLPRTGNRRGNEFLREADVCRAAFPKAYRAVIRKSKKWKAPDGLLVPFTPPTLAEAKSRTLRIKYAAPSRAKPARTFLHRPPIDGVERVVLNGKCVSQIGGTIPL